MNDRSPHAHVRRPSSPTTGAVVSGCLLAIVLLVSLAGCGGGLNVGSYTVTAVGRQRCAELISALPAKVDGMARRTDTGSAYAAAWGNPAIVLRCGVGKPAGLTRFSSCQRANGIDWFVPDSTIVDQRADVLMTTVGRSPAVDVLVPARYRPTVAPMVDLAAALTAHTSSTTPCQ